MMPGFMRDSDARGLSEFDSLPGFEYWVENPAVRDPVHDVRWNCWLANGRAMDLQAATYTELGSSESYAESEKCLTDSMVSCETLSQAGACFPQDQF